MNIPPALNPATWRANVQQKITHLPTWWAERKQRTAVPAGLMAYGTLTSFALWPVVEALTQTARTGQTLDPFTLTTAVMGMASGLGINLIASQLHGWYERVRGGGTAPTQTEVETWLTENITAIQPALDNLLEQTEALPAALHAFGQEQRAEFAQTLRHELQTLGNLPRFQLVLDQSRTYGSYATIVENSTVNGDVVGGQGNTLIKEQHIHQASDPSQPRAESLRHSYLNHLFTQCNQLPLAGIDPKAIGETGSRLQLGAVYTALLTKSSEGLGKDGVGEAILGGLMGHKDHRPLSAVAQLNAHPHLVLLGEPGGGKSTFVNFVILCTAGQLLGDANYNLALLTAPLPTEPKEERDADTPLETQPWTHGSLLPVRVILRDFAARGLPAIGQPATADHLWQFICAELSQASLGEYAPFLKKALLEQGGLLCLDGLDEVPEAEDNNRRLQIKQVVEDTARALPRCRLLITSRTYAYQQQAWQLADFASTELARYTLPQIKQFVTSWYNVVALARRQDTADYAGRAQLLLQTIQDTPRLYDLAERPLLLTLMASLHAWRGGNLPEKREELYRDAVTLLLDTWEQQRVVRDTAGNPINQQPSLEQWLQVDRDQMRRFLNKLAYEAHATQTELTGTADIPATTLVMGLLEISPHKNLPPQLLLEYLRDRAGLLVPHGVGVYTFPHRTFQEYLAACHLADEDYPDEVAELARTAPNKWREVALLAGAKAGFGSAFALWSLVNALCPAPPESHSEDPLADSWGGHLAGQLLVEAANLSQPSRANQRTLTRVANWLAHLLRNGQLPPTERALAGRHLAKLGDPRPEVTDVDHMPFAFVPAGAFVMGEPESEKPPHEAIKWSPQHPLTLPYGYWIGRFPVTNAHFAPFVAAGGYAEARYWPEAIAADLWKDGQISIYTYRLGLEKETRAHPADYGPDFTAPNQPRVGLSWYEALAYARWLTERWHTAGWLPPDWEVTLPSEAEWEKAARGGLETPIQSHLRPVADGLTAPQLPLQANDNPCRPYPWTGDEYTTEHANTKETGIGRPSAVGAFPLGTSPVGCEEMGGNVYEWTRSIWDVYDVQKNEFMGKYDYPYQPDDGRENLTADMYHARTARTGAYGLESAFGRCAARYRFNPRSVIDLFGLRLVVVPIQRSAL